MEKNADLAPVFAMVRARPQGKPRLWMSRIRKAFVFLAVSALFIIGALALGYFALKYPHWLKRDYGFRPAAARQVGG